MALNRAADWLRRQSGRFARGGALAVSLAGLTVFLRVMNEHYPIEKWLFWIYAEVWGLTLIFGAACLSVGNLLVHRLLRSTAPLRERLLLSFVAGVFVFAMGVFVVGLFHGLNLVFFVAWPALLIAVGARPLYRTGARVIRLLPYTRRLSARPSFMGGVALVFGIAGLAFVYVNILTPANVAFDARWYHLAIAEHYAAGGMVARFPEGWFCGTYPHLASLLYTWAFLIPNGGLFNRIELAAHLEFFLFAATLAGVAVLARWAMAATGQGRVRNAWAAVFLFPGLFLYDSSLSCAADHALAFWAPFIFLVLRRLWRSWDVREAVLLALIMAGAILTKYQAVYLLVVPGVALLVRAARTKGTEARRRLPAALLPLTAWGAGLLALTSSLWLKNWIWYGDPIYPMLPQLFGGHPWVPGTDPDKFLEITSWTPQGPLADRIRDTLKATVTFSFVPHDWWNLHGGLPVFGCLFTLTLPLLLFVKPRGRLLWLGLATMVGIATWYWTYHQDRYLQALLPWMAAFVAAILALVWRLGWTARVGLIGLVVTQVVWGGDVFTIPTHAMIGQQPMKLTLDLISSGYRKDWAARSESHQDLESIGLKLPPGSKVVVHDRLLHLGIGAMSVVDIAGTQGGISYKALATPERVYGLFRKWGVTHVVWQVGASTGTNLAADDLVFWDFVEKYLVHRMDFGAYALAELTLTPPPAVPEPRLVRLQTCTGGKTVRLDQLDAALAGTAVVPVENSSGPPAFFVVQADCAVLPPESIAMYRLLGHRTGYQFWSQNGPF